MLRWRTSRVQTSFDTYANALAHLHSLPKSALRKMSEHNLTGVDLLGVTDECATFLSLFLIRWTHTGINRVSALTRLSLTVLSRTPSCAGISVRSVR